MDIALGVAEVIVDPARIKELFLDLLKSAKEEVLLFLPYPHINMYVSEERVRLIQLLKEAAATTHKVNVHLIALINDSTQKIREDEKPDRNLEIRYINPTYKSAAACTVTIMVTDRKTSLAIESKDGPYENFVDELSGATYSTIKPTVSSYISMFENLSVQNELYEQVKTRNNSEGIH
jgi:sugar-specific transcriptional regulator TrmB